MLEESKFMAFVWRIDRWGWKLWLVPAYGKDCQWSNRWVLLWLGVYAQHDNVLGEYIRQRPRLRSKQCV